MILQHQLEVKTLRLYLHNILFLCCTTQAIEYSQHGEKVPSCIFPKGERGGALYHGGYKAVMNTSFLSECDIKYVVNTARGLEEVLGPKYKVR